MTRNRLCAGALLHLVGLLTQGVCSALHLIGDPGGELLGPIEADADAAVGTLNRERDPRVERLGPSASDADAAVGTLDRERRDSRVELLGPSASDADAAVGTLDRERWLGDMLYAMALREEGVNATRPRRVGIQDKKYFAYLTKFPRSWVKKIDELDHERTHRFNFVGALIDQSPFSQYAPGVRDWVAPFCEAHFRAKDFFLDTNPPQKYTSRGPYDRTPARQHRFSRNAPLMRNLLFDETYYTVLAKSNFTLAPAGDLPYSFRFIEAILAGSIPVVSEEKYASGEHRQWWQRTQFNHNIKWQYYLTSQDPDTYIYNQTWVDENRRLAIRYHTFIDGFHDEEVLGGVGVK